jgi:RNA polymerase sigma-70 factor (ECF subfamily)
MPENSIGGPNPTDDTNSDEARFAAWVQEHGSAVRGFIMAMVRRADVAEDLCQDVFVRAWKARGSYTEQGKTRSYLLRIADRLVCDRRRGSARATHLDDDGWSMHQPASTEPGPAETIELNEQVRQLNEAMKCLTPIQQRVLLLRYYGQMSFQEIADALDAPLNTALSHCHRALEALRKILVEDSV